MTHARVLEYDSYGTADVLIQRDASLPDAPGPRQVRIRVKAASVNPKDIFVRKGRFRMMTGDAFPRRVGYGFSGIVDQVGNEVAEIAVGDDVYGMLSGWDGGACADQVLASPRSRAPCATLASTWKTLWTWRSEPRSERTHIQPLASGSQFPNFGYVFSFASSAWAGRRRSG